MIFALVMPPGAAAHGKCDGEIEPSQVKIRATAAGLMETVQANNRLRITMGARGISVLYWARQQISPCQYAASLEVAGFCEHADLAV